MGLVNSFTHRMRLAHTRLRSLEGPEEPDDASVTPAAQAPPISAAEPEAGTQHAASSSARRTMPNREGERLVALIKSGDEAAFETVFRLFAPSLCSFAVHLVGRREVASDLVQDVFLRVWRNRAHLQIREGLQAYLYRAVRNRALDVLAHEDIEDLWVARSAERACHEQILSPRVEHEIDARDLTCALEDALQQLPSRQRQIFLLRWKEEMSYAEIGDLLRISPRTVEVHMHRAIHTLRAELAPYLAPSPDRAC
jgi:RNA polymerase sigma-70 factor (ECF subfamily)